MKCISALALFFLLFNCKNEAKLEESKTLTANEIVNKSIAVSGGNRYESSGTKFLFRDIEYFFYRNKGIYRFERRFTDSLTLIHDVLSNTGFERTREGIKEIYVADSLAAKYSSSINSVQYFAFLPYGLNDKAVNKRLLGEEQIKGKSYYKIEVTFDQNGGGEDYEDIFIYWINTKNFKVDYLAYSYIEDDDIGMRFREAYNERYVNGLRFVDYNNYKSDNSEITLGSLAQSFESNQLQLVSKIELENIKVDLIDL